MGFLSRFSRKEKSQVEEGYNKLEAQSISVYSFMLHHKTEKKKPIFFCVAGFKFPKYLIITPKKAALAFVGCQKRYTLQQVIKTCNYPSGPVL